jgi:hypothetical protein
VGHLDIFCQHCCTNLYQSKLTDKVKTILGLAMSIAQLEAMTEKDFSRHCKAAETAYRCFLPDHIIHEMEKTFKEVSDKLIDPFGVNEISKSYCLKFIERVVEDSRVDYLEKMRIFFNCVLSYASILGWSKAAFRDEVNLMRDLYKDPRFI